MGHSTSSGRNAAAGSSALESARRDVANDIQLQRRLERAIDRARIENRGFGEWQMDLEGVGGGQILDETGSSRDSAYGRGGRVYSVRAWDAEYNSQDSEMVEGSLNDAKRRLREMLHRLYGTRG